MSHGYVAVNWNARKKIYDLCLWAGIVLYIVIFVSVSKGTFSGAESISTLIILLRAFSTCAFILLTLILCIGPLARLDKRYLPLLYNRRHLGVSLFIVALIHALLAVYWYHGFGLVNPLISVLTSGGDYQSATDLPFQALGAAALFILFVMAATSHDYWNANLGGPLWKAIHMLVYFAYSLIVLHIVFGALQQDVTGLLPWMVMLSVGLVGGLHLVASFTGSAADIEIQSANETGGEIGGENWVSVGRSEDIPNNRAITVSINQQERVAIFRYDENKICAVSNVCQHQNGPLGEGRVIDGFITCPWHGYQYRPEDGCSPPPFTEKIKTYNLKLIKNEVFVAATPLPRGTPRPILTIGSENART